MKKYIKILIPCMILVLLLAGVGIAFLLSNSDPDDQGSILEDTPYSYQNPETAHAEYETDLFTIDGTLDEDIYSSLCWWEETYQEGEFQAPVNVKTTCYLGENGAYFIFDVDDDKVYVNPARISFANSCISLYVAEEGTTALNDNVWEIDIQPNNDINAKRYTGDLGFATILASGYENKPVIATATKGGAINTDDCKGYVMETYFPYEYLFGEGCEKPEKLKLNFALIRNFSADTNKSRDLYYNFGQNVITGWSWGNPDTWWTFEKYGLESVGLQLEAGEGGTFVDASNRLEKFLSHRIGIVPEEGYRIVSVTKTVGGETVDVTDQLTWEDGVSYLKLYLVTEDIALKATFEPIPQERYSLSGKITYKGKALSETELADIGVRYIDGGVGYTGELAGDGSYVLNVPAGQGRLEVCSKAGYVAKRQNVKIEAKDLQVNVDLTSNDYGNTRIISLPDEMVMRNGEVLFDGSNMLDTLNNTFAYDFTLTYDGKLLNDDGSIIKDPTFGKYANNFTVINIRGTFADQEGKDIANSNFLFQILHWDNDWRAKLYIDNQAIEQNISHKALLESFGEDGVRMRLLFADSKMGLYILDGSKCYKVYEKELAATADRYLKTLTFYSENCVNNSVWAIKDQQIALGRTPGNYSVTSLISIYKSKVTTAKYNVFEDFENLQIPGSWFNKYNISYQDVIDENGNVLKDATVTMRVKMQGSTFYNGLITIALKSSGVSKLTGGLGADPWTFFGGVILNADQLKQMGSEDGLDIFAVHSDGGKTMTVYVQDGDKLVPCWTVTDPSKELKLKGYEIQFDTAGGQVTAESVTHKGGFLDAVSQLYGDEYTVTDVITVHKSETTVKDTNTFVDYVDRLSVGNWFYRYDIKLPEAVDENGDITQAATAIMRTKMHGSMDYNSLIKLTLNPSGINTLEIGRGADPWDSQIVVLSDEQVKQLGTESGMSIFVVHTGNEKTAHFYLLDGDQLIPCRSITDPADQMRAKGYEAQLNVDNGSILVENVEHTCDFLDAAEAKYGERYTIVEAPTVITISEAEATVKNTNTFVDYGDNYISGNWFNSYNVKLPDAIDEEGYVTEAASVTLRVKMIGNVIYNSLIKLTLDPSGLNKVEGGLGADPWTAYSGMILTTQQLKQLSSEDGLNIYAVHNSGEMTMTVYIEDGNDLIPCWMITDPAVELKVKGYEAQTDTDNSSVTVESVMHKSAFLDVMQENYGKSYTVITDAADPIIVSRSKQTVKGTNSFVDYEDETVSGNWFNRYNVKIDNAVDADGNVTKDAVALLRVKLAGSGGIYNAMLRLTLSTGGDSVLTGTNVNGPSDYNFQNVVLTKEQLKQLGTEQGLNLYAVHNSGDTTVTVYVQDGTSLIPCWAIGGSTTELMCKGYEAQCDVDGFTVTVESVKHEAAFLDVVEARYGDACTIIDILAVSQSTATVKNVNTFVDYGDNTVGGNWFNRYSIRIDNAVDADGNVTQAAEALLRVKLAGSGGIYNAMLRLTLNTSGNSYLTGTNRNGPSDYNFYNVNLTGKQLKQLGTEEGLVLYAAHNSGDNTVTVYLQDGTDLIPCWTIGGSATELKCKGYEAKCNVDSFTIEVESVKHGNSFLDAVKTRYGDACTVTDTVLVAESTVTVSNTNTFVDYKNNSVGGSWFNRYNIQIDDAVDADGNVTKDAVVLLRIKMAGSSGIYNSMLRLTLSTGGDSILTGTNVNGPSDYAFKNVVLTKVQLKQLGTEEGLNLYAVHNSGGTTVTVYVQDGTELISCWTVGGSTTELVCKGYEAQCNVDGFAIAIESIKHGQDLLKVLEEQYGVTCTFG